MPRKKTNELVDEYINLLIEYRAKLEIFGASIAAEARWLGQIHWKGRALGLSDQQMQSHIEKILVNHVTLINENKGD